MRDTDLRIYKACLEILKSGSAFNKSSLARRSGLDRKTIYNVIEKHTFQDLEKYKTRTI